MKLPAATLVAVVAGLALLGRADVPRQRDPAAQLAHAAAVKHALRGKRGAERAEQRLRAVRAYRAVRHYFPEALPACAEAAFRAGELLRSGGGVEEAMREFRLAREQGAGTEYRARGSIELGHVYRRTRRLHDALDAYVQVVTDEEAAQEHRDTASLWEARVQYRLGRAKDARRAWRRVAGEAEDPLDRVRAYDEWIDSLVDEAALEEAAGVLARCREALQDRALEETAQGRRLRLALEHMRSVERLAAAVEARERIRKERAQREGQRPRPTPEPPPVIGARSSGRLHPPPPAPPVRAGARRLSSPSRSR